MAIQREIQTNFFSSIVLVRNDLCEEKQWIFSWWIFGKMFPNQNEWLEQLSDWIWSFFLLGEWTDFNRCYWNTLHRVLSNVRFIRFLFTRIKKTIFLNCFLLANLSSMLLSTFSHYNGLHFLCNMYVLWSFSDPIVRMFGKEQFFGK